MKHLPSRLSSSSWYALLERKEPGRSVSSLPTRYPRPLFCAIASLRGLLLRTFGTRVAIAPNRSLRINPLSFANEPITTAAKTQLEILYRSARFSNGCNTDRLMMHNAAQISNLLLQVHQEHK